MPHSRRNQPTLTFRRLILAAVIALPLLWVGTWAYAQWQDPDCSGAGANPCPPYSQIPGVAWLFPATETSYQPGGLRVSGDVATQANVVVTGNVTTPTGTVSAANGVFAGVGTNIVSSVGLANQRAFYGQAAISSAVGVYGDAVAAGSTAVYGNAPDPTSWAGYFSGRVLAKQYCLPGATPADPPVCGGAGTPGVGSNQLWSLEGTTTNIFKGTAADLSGIVAIGTATPSTVGYPVGTRLALEGAGGKSPRIMLDSTTGVVNTLGNPEVDFKLTASADDHWAVYTDQSSRQLRFWSKEAAGTPVGIGRNNIAFSSDGVIVFAGWGPTRPTIITNAAGPVSSLSATLNSSVNPNSDATTVWYRYSTGSPGTTCADSATWGGVATVKTTPVSVGNGTVAVNNATAISGLTNSKVYYFCALAQNGSGVSYGAVLSFTTTAIPSPTVTTTSATLILPGAATLNGSANPNGFATTAWFRYSTALPTGGVVDGTCPSAVEDVVTPWGTRTSGPDQALGSGLVSASYAMGVTGLSGNTTYYYCAIAQNTGGKGFGQIIQFATPAGPSATTGAASGITSSGATLSGVANGNGGSNTIAWFRYSGANPGTCNDTFGTRSPTSSGWGVSTSSNTNIIQGIVALNPSTTYYYCMLASNANGVAMGSIASFQTSAPPAPTVTTNSATISSSGTTVSSASLSGTVSSNGITASAWFRYSTAIPAGCDDSFGTRIPASGGTSINGTLSYTQSPGGLSVSTLYYFCAIASSSSGTSFGTIRQFTYMPNPSATTVNVTSQSCGSACAATLNGNGNPNGRPTTAWFRYSTSNPGTCNDTFGGRTISSSDRNLGTGTAALNYSIGISGLSGSTTYYWCAIDKNANDGGYGYGAMAQFTTGPINIIINPGT